MFFIKLLKCAEILCANAGTCKPHIWPEPVKKKIRSPLADMRKFPGKKMREIGACRKCWKMQTALAPPPTLCLTVEPLLGCLVSRTAITFSQWRISKNRLFGKQLVSQGGQNVRRGVSLGGGHLLRGRCWGRLVQGKRETQGKIKHQPLNLTVRQRCHHNIKTQTSY